MSNIAVEGIANLRNDGARLSGWLQVYRLLCYLYDVDLLLSAFAVCGVNMNGIRVKALNI